MSLSKDRIGKSYTGTLVASAPCHSMHQATIGPQSTFSVIEGKP